MFYHKVMDVSYKTLSRYWQKKNKVFQASEADFLTQNKNVCHRQELNAMTNLKNGYLNASPNFLYFGRITVNVYMRPYIIQKEKMYNQVTNSYYVVSFQLK